MITRREMLRGIGNAIAAVAISKLVPAFGSVNVLAAPISIEQFQDFLFASETEFDADNSEWVGEAQLSGPAAALSQLHQIHGLDWRFSEQVDYRNASQCRTNFQNCEENFRRRSSNVFTDVQRSREDRDISYLVGASFNRNTRNWNQIIGATQYQGNLAIQIENDEPGIVLAASQIFDENYALQSRELAQSATLTSYPQSSVVRVGNENLTEKRYSTPRTEIVHYPRPVRTGNRVYNKGVIAVRRKNAAGRWKFKGIYV